MFRWMLLYRCTARAEKFFSVHRVLDNPKQLKALSQRPHDDSFMNGNGVIAQ
tara:strand:+ start:546 stop:701 length:156 start_codon:yes stop_codon:yes gene_type:complete